MAPTNNADNFSEGEKVLCYHGNLIYEAKLLEKGTKEKSRKILVHYAGWSKKWDEWVHEDRLLKYNAANLAKKTDIDEKPPTKKKGKGKGRNSTGLNKTDDVRSEGSVNDSDSGSSTPILELKGRVKIEKKRLSISPINEIAPESKKPKRQKPQVTLESDDKLSNNIRVPTELIPFLIDDYLMVVKKKKLQIIPSKFTVEDVINDFIEDKKSKADEHAANVSRCVVLGVRDYFNILLSSKLLYKEEWAQYSKAINDSPDKPPSQMYGTYHLLRLFIKLGSVATLSHINDVTMSIVMNYIQEFLGYLISNSSKYFSLTNFS